MPWVGPVAGLLFTPIYMPLILEALEVPISILIMLRLPPLITSSTIVDGFDQSLIRLSILITPCILILPLVIPRSTWPNLLWLQSSGQPVSSQVPEGFHSSH